MTTTDPILFYLGVAIATLAALLLLSAGLLLGRKLADLAYQHAAGINGVRRIQSRVNIRTQGNRVFLAVAFLAVAFLIVYGLDLWWRTLVTRAIVIAVLGGYVTSSVLDWIDEDRCMRHILDEEAHKRHQGGAAT